MVRWPALGFVLFSTCIDELVTKEKNSLFVPGGDEDLVAIAEGEVKLPSCMDYVMHFLTVFWKVLFACVPPTGKSSDDDDDDYEHRSRAIKNEIDWVTLVVVGKLAYIALKPNIPSGFSNKKGTINGALCI